MPLGLNRESCFQICKLCSVCKFPPWGARCCRQMTPAPAARYAGLLFVVLPGATVAADSGWCFAMVPPLFLYLHFVVIAGRRRA